METLFFAPLRLISAVLPHMRKRRFVVIVNFSSGASLEGNSSMGAYTGAKGISMVYTLFLHRPISKGRG